LELKTKNSKQFKIIAGESEYVSSAHNTGFGELQNITDNYEYNSKTTKVHEDNDCTDLDIWTMHANQVTHYLKEQVQTFLSHSLTLHKQLTKQPK
jgi:hypothetical protein